MGRLSKQNISVEGGPFYGQTYVVNRTLLGQLRIPASLMIAVPIPLTKFKILGHH